MGLALIKFLIEYFFTASSRFSFVPKLPNNMTDLKMIKSVKTLLNMPAYVYVAGFIGAAATYVLYSPTSSSKSSKLSKSPTFKNSRSRFLKTLPWSSA